jgi:hypothetical protein
VISPLLLKYRTRPNNLRGILARCEGDVKRNEYIKGCVQIWGRTLPQVLTEQAAIFSSNLREGVSA